MLLVTTYPYIYDCVLASWLSWGCTVSSITARPSPLDTLEAASEPQGGEDLAD